MLTIVAMLVLQSGSVGACQRIQKQRLSQLLAKIELSANDVDQREHSIFLGAYWDKTCMSDRRKMAAKNVSEIGKLLRIRVARPVVESMLFDVGNNLRSALPSLKQAYKDELKIDKEQLRRSYPLVPTTYQISSTSLRCLIRKASTNVVDAHLCRFLVTQTRQERG